MRIKILVTYHKKTTLFKNDIFVPIHLGRTLIDENYIDNYNLKAGYIKELVGKYDILVANKWNVNQNKMKNNYEQYEKSDLKLHVDDYNESLSILEEKYPDYKEDIKNYNSSKYGYYRQGYCGVAYGYRGLGGINLSEEQLNEVNKILTPEQKELLNYYQQYGYYGKGYFRDVNGIRGLGRINLSEEQLNKINNILTSEQRKQLNYCRLYR